MDGLLDNIVSLTSKILSPVVLICMAFILMAIYFFKGHTNFLNIKRIFKDYFSLFGEEKIHLMVVWGIPLLIAGALVQEIYLGKESLDEILVILSILISMFFAMLSILISKQATQNDIDQKSNSYKQHIRNILLAETCTIVLIEVLLCVSVLMLSLVIVLISGDDTHDVLSILSFLVFYFMTVCMFNLLVLLKRFKSLIDNP